MSPIRKTYPSDVFDDEWALVAPCLTLVRENAGQREHPLREVFDGLRYVVETGAPWGWMPNDLPPWAPVYQQAQRWHATGCFEQLAEDLRAMLRLAAGRKADPCAVILDSRTLRATPENGERAGSDGARHKRGQAQAGLEAAHGGGYARPSPGPARHARPCRRPDRAQVGRGRLCPPYIGGSR